jgi:predicted permease
MLRTLFLILPFGNFAYLGIPVIQSAYGDEMLPAAAVLSAVDLFWVLTLTIVLIEALGEDGVHPKKLLLSLAKNPLLLSVLVGLAIALLQIELPFVAKKTIHLFSNSVTAIILFALGLFLGTQQLGKPKEWYPVIVLVITTMLILPACYYAYLKIIGMDEMLTKASIIDAAMPLGLTPYVLTSFYKLENKLAARVVVFGTLLSIVIIPLWMVWLG